MRAKEAAELVQEDRVHGRVYTDPAVFELEMKYVWGQAWLFACHESQIPKANDFFTLTLGRQPILITRDDDGRVKGFFNRCPHRGSLVTNLEHGNARKFSCPYHGWTFNCAGSLIGVPYKGAYSDEFLETNLPKLGLAPVPRLQSYRGFVFVSFAYEGTPFEDFVSQLSAGIDNLLDRTPEGAIEVRGVHRYAYKGNWKQQIENGLDEYHPIFAHASTLAAKSGRQIRRTFGHTEEGGRMLNSENEDAYTERKSYFDNGGVVRYPYGQTYLANSHKSWAGDLVDPGYRALLTERHGQTRFDEIVDETIMENAVFYPNLIFRVTGNTHLRVVKPISVDQSEVWVWPLVPTGAPDYVQQGTIRFANMHTSPSSLIQTDDLEIFERVQKGLQANEPEWVMLARGFGREIPGEHGEHRAEGTWETGMRNQFSYWKQLMLEAAE